MYATIHEKYADISKKTRLMRGLSWYENPSMTADLPEGNFVLIQIPDDQYNRENGAWKEQGYIKYVPQVATTAPIEAKRVKRERPEQEEVNAEN
jgi:hypothetical protein